MSGPVSGRTRRASRLLPWLALTASIGTAFAVWVTVAEPPEPPTLMHIPDRFVHIVAPEEADKEASPPIVASRRSVDAEAEAAPDEPADLPPDAPSASKEEVLKKSKLLMKLIGTTGESTSTAADLFGDGDLGLDGDGALDMAGGAPVDAGAATSAGRGIVGTLGGPGVVGEQVVRTESEISSGPAFEGEDFVVAEVDPLSTFSIDVDTGSWTRTVSTLRAGRRPRASQVRVEEFVNAFHYDYDTPTDGRAFAVHALAAPSPWNDELHLLRIGLQAEEVSEDDAPPVHLTFLIDTSCSMADADKLPLVKQSLHGLVDRLRPTDTVAIVTYAGSSEVVLGRTGAGWTQPLHEAVDRLTNSGGTAMANGVYTAYALASEALEEPARWSGLHVPLGGKAQADAVHRVVMVSDGDANIGPSDPQGILPSIRDHAARGITLTSLGVGQSGYRDDMMERLADEGDGAYHFIATRGDADRVLGTELTSTLHVVARDTKVQVAFDPAVVGRYRLVGYDNRRLRDRDFDDDAIDAGEVGSGHQVTALYELQLLQPDAPLGEVRLRYKPPGPDAPSQEVVAVMGPSTVPSLEHASSSMRAAVAVAGVARVLRKEEGFGRERLPGLEQLARSAGVDPTRVEELWDVLRSLR